MTTPFSIDCVFSDNFDELKKLNIDELKECDDLGRNVFHAVCSRQKPDSNKYDNCKYFSAYSEACNYILKLI